MSERERLTWEDFGAATRPLAQRIADDGYLPDVVLSVARGGLLVGAALGYALNVKSTWVLNVEFHTGVDERLDVPVLLPPVPELDDLESSRVLIADDVADTGERLRVVKELCAGRVADVRCAVLYEKPASIGTSGKGRISGSTSRGARGRRWCACALQPWRGRRNAGRLRPIGECVPRIAVREDVTTQRF